MCAPARHKTDLPDKNIFLITSNLPYQQTINPTNKQLTHMSKQNISSQIQGVIEKTVEEKLKLNIQKICAARTHAIPPAALRGRVPVIAPYVNPEQVGLTNEFEYDLKKWIQYELYYPSMNIYKLDSSDKNFSNFDSFQQFIQKQDISVVSARAMQFNSTNTNPSQKSLYEAILTYCKPALYKLIENDNLVDNSDWTIIWRPHINTSVDIQIGTWHVDTFVSEPEKMAYAFTIGDDDVVATQYVNIPMLKPADFNEKTLHEQSVIQNLAADISLRALAKDNTYVSDTIARHKQTLDGKISRANQKVLTVSFDVSNNDKDPIQNILLKIFTEANITFDSAPNSNITKISIEPKEDTAYNGLENKIRKILSDYKTSNYNFVLSKSKKYGGTWNIIESLDKTTLAEFAQKTIHYGIPNGKRHFFLLIRKTPQQNPRQVYGQAALDYYYRSLSVEDKNAYAIETYNADCQNKFYSFKHKIDSSTANIVAAYNKIVTFCDELEKISIATSSFPQISKEQVLGYFIALCLSQPQNFFENHTSHSLVVKDFVQEFKEDGIRKKKFDLRGSDMCFFVKVVFSTSQILNDSLLTMLENAIYNIVNFYPDMRYEENTKSLIIFFRTSTIRSKMAELQRLAAMENVLELTDLNYAHQIDEHINKLNVVLDDVLNSTSDQHPTVLEKLDILEEATKSQGFRIGKTVGAIEDSLNKLIIDILKNLNISVKNINVSKEEYPGTNYLPTSGLVTEPVTWQSLPIPLQSMGYTQETLLELEYNTFFSGLQRSSAGGRSMSWRHTRRRPNCRKVRDLKTRKLSKKNKKSRGRKRRIHRTSRCK